MSLGNHCSIVEAYLNWLCAFSHILNHHLVNHLINWLPCHLAKDMELFLFIIILDGESFFKRNAVHIAHIENPPYILCLPILRHKFLFQFNFFFKFWRMWWSWVEFTLLNLLPRFSFVVKRLYLCLCLNSDRCRFANYDLFFLIFFSQNLLITWRSFEPLFVWDIP